MCALLQMFNLPIPQTHQAFCIRVFALAFSPSGVFFPQSSSDWLPLITQVLAEMSLSQRDYLRLTQLTFSFINLFT